MPMPTAWCSGHSHCCDACAPTAPDVSRAHAAGPHASRLLVYGTLRRGEANDITRLYPAPRLLGLVRVPGTLYDLGPYPGLRLGGAGRVVGEVYAIAPELETQLDRIEDVSPHPGAEYARRDIEVVMPGGARLSCLVYEVSMQRVQGLAPMPGGDWVRHRQRRH